MIGNYLRIIFTCLAIYCVAFNLLMFIVEDYMTEKVKKIIKRIYFSAWLVPTGIYIYILSNSTYAEHYFFRNLFAGIILHVMMAYFGYRATLE
ncbi:hypothetical protein [Caloranaerobacter ferrireducens]|uniref:hypothetical protein n=1 Tax=Caloranaerobacter ferrireducens TaxID=1323370 RepID=UPI00084D849A|nr:hypothetical protein [Caloranaerobacter ferrireducens]